MKANHQVGSGFKSVIDVSGVRGRQDFVRVEIDELADRTVALRRASIEKVHAGFNGHGLLTRWSDCTGVDDDRYGSWRPDDDGGLRILRSARTDGRRDGHKH